MSDQQGNNLSLDMNFVDESSSTQLSASNNSGSNAVGVSYMQALTPTLALGGGCL